MKPKTRYNVRLAEKKGVALRVGTKEDLPMLYKMYAETSVRDGFVIRDEEYYQTVWRTFMNSSFIIHPSSFPLRSSPRAIPSPRHHLRILSHAGFGDRLSVFKVLGYM